MDSESVYQGFWRDKSHSGFYAFRSLRTDGGATFWTTFLGVWWSLGNPFIYKICATLAVLLWSACLRRSRYRRISTGDPDAGDGDTASAQELFESNPQIIVMARKFVEHACQPGSKPYFQSAWFFFCAILFFCGSAVFGTYLTTFVNPSDGNTALWSSSHCGIWDISDKLSNSSAIRRSSLDLTKEIRAGEYVEQCYAKEDAFSTMRCSSFYSPRIQIRRSNPVTCDAFDDSIRMDGQTSVEFHTDLVDSGDIGVNSWHPYKFQRKTCCMPLKQDGFIKKEVEDGLDTYYYYYGTQPDSEYTYITKGDPSESGAGGYEVNTWITHRILNKSHWTPIQQLTPPPGARVTIIFVNTLLLYYKTQSQDPIFPANNQTYKGNDPNPFFYHSDPRARAVACVDETYHCTPDGETCWTFADEEDHPVPISEREYYFMNYSLLYSNMFTSLALRLRTALLAQKNVSQYISPGFEADHWKLEMESLFNTSLARIQFDAWSIASGEGRRLDGFVRQLPERGSELNICGLFKFRTNGYINILLWPYFIIASMPVVFGVLSLDLKLPRHKKSDEIPEAGADIPDPGLLASGGAPITPPPASNPETWVSTASLDVSGVEAEGSDLALESTNPEVQFASSSSLSLPRNQQQAQQIQSARGNGEEEGEEPRENEPEDAYHEHVIVLTVLLYPDTWKLVATKLSEAWSAIQDLRHLY